MKTIILKILKFYKKYWSRGYHCRMVPSCSEYAGEAIEKYGVIKGGWMAVKRIVSCRPGGKSGVDLVK